MRLGYNEATCMENSSLEQDLILCEKYGYDDIELRIDMLEAYLQTHTVEDLQAFFSASHVKPFSINAIDYINFTSPAQWEEVRRQALFSCRVARRIGCRYLIVCPSKADTYFTKTEQEVFDDTVSVLCRLSDLAGPYGVSIAFEPVGDRRWCCNSLRFATEIVNAVDRDNVGLTVDCINFYMHDKCADMASIRNIPRGKLFIYHINDCEDRPFGVLDHCHRIMPGKGCIPVAEITEAVQSAGYDGPACLELFRPAYWAMEADAVFRLGVCCTRPFLRQACAPQKQKPNY